MSLTSDWIVVPTHTQHTATKTINARSAPAREWSCSSSVDTSVTAKTKTRSKNSSAHDTRFSVESGILP